MPIAILCVELQGCVFQCLINVFVQVKRAYMKANLVVHPDKVKQKGGSLEQVATADMVFHILNAAWGKFT